MADIPGDTTTRARLAVGETLTGTIDTSGDHDWYKVRLVAGQSYTFSTSQSGDPLDTTLTLRDAAGTFLTTNDDSNGTLYSTITFTATTTGTYFLDAGEYSTGVGTFAVSMAKVVPPPPLPIYTYDQIANQLTDDGWVLFGGARRAFDIAPGGRLTVNITALTAEGQALAREALATWTDVTGIRFREVTGTAQIDFDDDQSGAFADSTVSGATIQSSIVNISTDWIAAYGTGLDTYSFQTYLHEIGHAIGLAHAGDYNGSADYPTDAKFRNDAWNASIMSYFSPSENTYFADQGFTYQFVGTPMVGDSVATTVLYGANTRTRTGDTTYGFNDTSGRAIYDAAEYSVIAYTVYDNGGHDTLDYSGFAANQVIDLRAETFMNVGGRVGNVMIARGAVIEDAIGGSGDDRVSGNAAANALKGGAGVDYLEGRGGADSLEGGAGADTFGFATGDLGRRATLSDTVLDFAQGSDRLDFSRYDAVSATTAVEAFTFIGRTAFSGTAGELRFVPTAGVTTVQGDVDGDGKADFVLSLTGRIVLTADDFVLVAGAEPLGAKALPASAPHPFQGMKLDHGTILTPAMAAGPGHGDVPTSGHGAEIHLFPDLMLV